MRFGFTLSLFLESPTPELNRHLVSAHRGLQFTALAMRRSLDNPSEELSESFTQAYAGSLKQFHSFVVKPIFTVRLSFSKT